MVRVVGTDGGAESTSRDVSEISNRSSSRRQPAVDGDALPSAGYNVRIPPRKGLLTEITDRLKETFLHDDPLRPYKGQTAWTKVLLALQYLFPILDWGRHYNPKIFRGDFIAGLTIPTLCIPQDIAYSKLANLDPSIGLYSSFVPPLIYAAMGSSRELAVGTAAVLSLLLGTLLQQEVDHVTDKETYKRLAFTATFFAGVTQAALGIFRLGFVIDFLSHAAIVGFMAGVAINIGFQQLKGFLGIRQFTNKTDIVNIMKSIWRPVHHGWNWQTIVIAATCLVFLLTAQYIAKKRKKLFWVAAIAPMITIILSTFFVYITHADKHGVQIEAVVFGRTFAALKDYQIDGNKEMLALGTMNIAGSLTSCYIAKANRFFFAFGCKLHGRSPDDKLLFPIWSCQWS